VTNRRAFFNEVASNWDDKFSNSVTSDFLEMLVSRLKLRTGMKVLDVGTGTGILIPTLAKAVGNSGLVVAVDFAEKMVETSKRKYSGLSNVKIEIKNAENLDYPVGYFDAVICFGMFPHIQNKEKALARMSFVLKSKGKLMIAHALGSKELNELHSREAPLIANDILPSKREMSKLLKNSWLFN
jgi:demethylmenaquinone methyltransferase/2-methoxy-6-polyprenyl-1,4-benzoquinol methylase